MQTINYGNINDQKGNKKSLVVTTEIYKKVVDNCKGHFGFGGQNKNSYYVSVTDWNKALKIVNEGIKNGLLTYVKREIKIKLFS